VAGEDVLCDWVERVLGNEFEEVEARAEYHVLVFEGF
jgi:hypothetical protein